MRKTLTMFALCSGLVLGACNDDGDDHGDHSECTDAQTMRIDAVLDLTADETAGAIVFSQTCGASSCHGADGNAGAAPDLAQEVPEHDGDALACLLLTGQNNMPSQSGLTDQQLADVLAYVQATF